MACTSYEDRCTFKIASRWIIIGMRIFRKILQRIWKYKFYFQFPFFPRKSCPYEIWETHGTVRQAIDGNIIWRMRIACWITEATDTLRLRNTYSFSMASTVTRTYLNVTLYVRLYYLPCISINQEQLLGSKPRTPCMLSCMQTASGIPYSN